MKARNLVSLLKKGANTDTEVTLLIGNSEKEFTVTNVTSSVGKKILVCEIAEDENKLPLGDSVENQKERTEKETKEDQVKEEAVKAVTPKPVKKPENKEKK